MILLLNMTEPSHWSLLAFLPLDMELLAIVRGDDDSFWLS